MKIKSYKTVVFVLLISLFFPQTISQAQPLPEWESLGPNFGWVRSLEFAPGDPNIVFSSTALSMYQSLDNGENWQTSPDKGCNFPMILAISPIDPDTIYGLICNFLHVKHGEGSVWVDIDPNRNSIFTGPKFLLIDPVTPTTIYTISRGGVYRSYDEGINWVRLTPPNEVTDDPKNMTFGDGKLFLLTEYSLFYSEDEGNSWLKVNLNLRFIVQDGIRYDALNNLLYTFGQNSLYRVDFKNEFAERIFYTQWQFWNVVFDQTNPNFMYATTGYEGFVRSTDGGETWVISNNGLDGRATYVTDALQIDPTDPSHIFIGTNEGLYESFDRGVNWTLVAHGPNDSGTAHVISDSEELYSEDQAGKLYHLDKSSGVWTDPAVNLGYLAAIGVSPSNLDILYAYWDDNYYQSTDSSATWTLLQSQMLLTYLESRRIQVSPHDPQLVFGLHGKRGASRSPLIRRNDQGVFEAVFNADLEESELVFDPLNIDVIYLKGNDRVYKSSDRGLNWVEVTGMMWVPTDQPYLTVNKDLDIDPANSDLVFVAREDALYRSSDGAATWEIIQPEFGEKVTAVTVKSGGEEIYLGTSISRIYRCDVNARNCSLLANNLTNRPISLIYLEYSDPVTVYASGTSGFLFRYVDEGHFYPWKKNGYLPITLIGVNGVNKQNP